MSEPPSLLPTPSVITHLLDPLPLAHALHRLLACSRHARTHGLHSCSSYRILPLSCVPYLASVWRTISCLCLAYHTLPLSGVPYLASAWHAISCLCLACQADHGGLLRVFHHLLQPLHPAFEPPTVATDPSAREATNPIDSSGGEQLQQHSPPNSSAMSCRRRRRRRQQQQQQQQHLPENDPADGVSAEVPQGPQPLLPRPRLVSAVSCGQVAGRATVASTTQHGIPPAPLPGKPAATDKEQVRLKVCLRSAATGLSEVCMRYA